MAARLDVDWTMAETLADEFLLDAFPPVAKQLSGLTVQEHSDGRVLMLVDEDRVLRHAVYNISDNNWGCFCQVALDGECAATTYARVRLMKDLDDKFPEA